MPLKNFKSEETDEDIIYKCEKIVKMKYNHKRHRNEYLLKWFGYPDSENTWEPIENIIDKNLIKDFQERIRDSARNIKPAEKLKFDREVFDADSDSGPEKVKMKPPVQPKLTKKLFPAQLPSFQSPLRKNSVHSKPQLNSAKIRSKSNTSNHCRALFDSTSNEKKQNSSNKKRKSTPDQPLGINTFPIQKICKPNVSVKYMNGSEPKIINQSIDPLSGKLMYELKWRFEFNSEVKEAIFVASKYPEAVELFKKNSTNGSRPNENTDPAVNREHSKIDAFKTNRIETVRNDDTLKHSEAVIGLSFKESTDTALDIEIHDSHTSGTKKNENVFGNIQNKPETIVVTAEETSQDWSMEDTNKYTEQMDVDISDNSNKETQYPLKTEETLIETQKQEPEKIISLYEENGEKKFIIKWKNTNGTAIIPTKLANLEYPQLVIAFYEENTVIDRNSNCY